MGKKQELPLKKLEVDLLDKQKRSSLLCLLAKIKCKNQNKTAS